ncbi:MAG: hypothetical protein QOG68_609, partial [Solirubrobacteraceae bacterium]|nr:hypothetical protein [Solirubrobacteraceae bacterium]
MTSAARIVFALLVAATFGAFFVAQRLKHTPTVLQQVHGPLVFSPNGDGRNDTLPISFEIKSADAISVDVLDANDNEVATLATDRAIGAHQQTIVRWNGRFETGGHAPDGIYRVRVSLREEGRTVVIRHRYRLDATPPRPRVVAVDPAAATGPALLPNQLGQVRIHTGPTGAEPSVAIFKTSGATPSLAARLQLSDRVATWDGRINGKPADPGTYVAVAQWRDRAGNLGSSVPIDRKTGAPALHYGETFPGRGGITVRYLELQPPAEPVRGGAVITVGVDARGARYRWDLRRLGAV